MFELISELRSANLFTALSHCADLLKILTDLEENYSADKNAKDAVIDTMIQVLQAHKTQKPGG